MWFNRKQAFIIFACPFGSSMLLSILPRYSYKLVIIHLFPLFHPLLYIILYNININSSDPSIVKYRNLVNGNWSNGWCDEGQLLAEIYIFKCIYAYVCFVDRMVYDMIPPVLLCYFYYFTTIFITCIWFCVEVDHTRVVMLIYCQCHSNINNQKSRGKILNISILTSEVKKFGMKRKWKWCNRVGVIRFKKKKKKSRGNMQLRSIFLKSLNDFGTPFFYKYIPNAIF